MLFQRRLGLLEWWTWGKGAWVFQSEHQGSTSEAWPAAGCHRVCFKDSPAVSEPQQTQPWKYQLSVEAKLLVLRKPSPALPLLPDSIYDGLPKCVFQRKKDQEEDTKTHLHQGCGNIENFLFCILKVFYTLHFKRMPGGSPCVTVPILSLSSWAVPQGRFIPHNPHPQPSTRVGQHLRPPGLPSLWSAKESSEAFWHQLSMLSPHAPTVAACFGHTILLCTDP